MESPVRDFIRVPVFSEGQYEGLSRYEDLLHTFKHGARVSLKVELQMWNAKGHVCCTHLARRKVVLLADVSPTANKLSLLHVRVDKSQGDVRLVHDDLSHVLELSHVTPASAFSLKEFCTGIGGMGIGAEYAGFRVTACNEKQAPFCNLLSQVSKAKVIEGDMSMLDVIAKMHAASEESASIGVGFNCQSFSSAGDKKGGLDERAMTLPWALWAGYMLNAPVITLECVADAPTFPWVRKCLQQFRECTNYEQSEVILELSHLWPSNRKRWWCVLSHGAFGKVPLSPLPKFERTPVVSDLMDDFRKLPENLLQQLALQDSELRQLDKLGTNFDTITAHPHATMPTALHSWGNQLSACKCLCRPQGLSEARLLKRGSCSVDRLPLTMPIGDARLQIAAVGQVASPTQSCWVFSCIRRHLETAGFAIQPPQLVGTGLYDLVQDLFQLRDATVTAPCEHTLGMTSFQEKMTCLLAPMSTKALQAPSRPSDELQDRDILHALETSMIATPERSGSEVESIRACDIPGAAPGFATGVPHGAPAMEDQPPMKKFRINCDSFLPTTDAIEEAKDTSSEPGGDHPDGQAATSVNAGEEGSSRAPSDDSGSDAEAESPAREPTSECESDPAAREQGLESEVDEGPTRVLHAPFAGTAISPQDLLDSKVVIMNRINGQLSSYAVTDETLVGTLRQAEAQLMEMPVDQVQVYDVVGQVLSDSDLVANNQCLVLLMPGQEQTVPDQLSEEWLASLPRAVSALCQGAGVADDEMRYYLSALEPQGIKVHPPLLMDNFEDCWLRGAEWVKELCADSEVPVASMILANRHWIPVVRSGRDDEQIITTDAGVQVLKGMVPTADVRSEGPLPLKFPYDCGFQAFAWTIVQLDLSHVSAIMSTDMAASWRHLFWQAVLVRGDGPVCFRMMLGGHGDELHIAVAALLTAHGVNHGQALARAGDTITALGKEPVQRALQSVRPWQQMKHIANRCAPPYQLILPDELAAVVKDRQAKGESIGRSAKKNPKKASTPTPPVRLRPEDIHIPPGVFIDEEGRPACQLTSKNLLQTRTGVMVCEEDEAKPYVQQGVGTLSKEGLLFIIINPSSECISQHGEPLRFPAQCKHTGEPILLSAVILQMGQKPIARARPAMVPSLAEVAVITVKMIVFRDQVQQSWHDFASAPFKQVLQRVPCLAVCRHSNCSCEGWHKGSDSNETEPLLDVWNREFLTFQYKRTKPEDADLYSCSARVRADLFPKLAQMAAQDGFYVEPRSPDGRRQHEGYHTVWLPRLTHAEAVAACNRSPKNAFVVRVHKRYGLKVARDDGEAVHRFFHQDSPFLGDTGLRTFQLGPLPWGTTRAILQKQFTEWQWSAVPLHPLGQSECGKGLMWMAKAKADPVCAVITMAHGDVIIVPREAVRVPTPIIPKVEASQLTKRMLHQSDEKEPFDPWAKAAAALPGLKAPQRDVVSQAQFRQLEERLTAKIDGSKESEDAEMLPDHEQRLRTMEAQIQQLQVGQQQQIASTQELRSQVETQGQAFQQHVDHKMNEQLEKIEAMLNKRKFME
eukprot:Skav234011  [mRNA]  locus=scaffold3484:97196:101892:+ [translate_table: standard]